jgi:hypothetical protein
MPVGRGFYLGKGRNGMINNSLLQRIEFGFTRTACSCDEDVLNCYFIPGYLIPDDLSRLADHLSVENVFDLARDYLLAFSWSNRRPEYWGDV